MSYNTQLQSLVDEYRECGMRWPASTKSIAAWAINTGRWKPQPSSIINQCADHIGRALREEYITDPQGRHVRAKHAATKILEHGKQESLWEDIRTASREHMQLSIQQRRHQIVGDCRQLKTDVDSYNQNSNGGAPIQVVFDFTFDLAELEAADEAA